jgi:very-short-patch-repair endonuclease
MSDVHSDAAQAKLFAGWGRPTKKPKRGASQEDLFAFQCKSRQLPSVERNFRFAQSVKRQWRFDFAFLDAKLAVEVEGLVVHRIGTELVCTGRHASVDGFRQDCVKYATAALLGWTVLRFEQSQVKTGYAIEMAQKLLFARGHWDGGQKS